MGPAPLKYRWTQRQSLALLPGRLQHRRAGPSRYRLPRGGIKGTRRRYTDNHVDHPGTHVESPETAIRLAAMVNDAFADVVESKAGRFTALATLPLNVPEASVKELERACRQLHMAGAMLFSNVNGVGLDDRRFWPLYEAANDLGAVLYIHPTHPVGVEAMTDYWLMPLVGFLCDTTLAAAKIVFSGVAERFPRIRWALCHMGGAIPYLGRAAGPRLRSFRRVPREHFETTHGILEEVLLRHGEFRSQGRGTGDRVCGRGSHSGGQRLSAPDRQHPEDAGNSRRLCLFRMRTGAAFLGATRHCYWGCKWRAPGKLTLLPLIAATYFIVSGGPFGLEDIVSKSGYAGAILILLITPLVWSVPTALMVAELASAFPQEGGYYVYVTRGLGRFWGFQEAWLSLVGSIFDMAIYPTLFRGLFGPLRAGADIRTGGALRSALRSSPWLPYGTCWE